MKQPLGTITNVNNNRRGQDHNPHFAMTDAAPAQGTAAYQTENNDPTKNTSNVVKARDDQDPHWGFDGTPIKDKKVYKTAGDGMGGRAGARDWAIGEDDGPIQYGGKGGQKQVYKTAGNGMGGKKGTGLSWSIGYE